VVIVMLVCSAQRGRRHPLGAHTSAVGPCRADFAALLGLRVAPRNSLRELRSLRSNTRGEFDGRCALRAPTRSPALLTAAQIAPTGYRLPRRPVLGRASTPFAGKGACGRAAGRLGSAEQRSERGPRAQRASSTDSSQLFERSERSERSEFCDGAVVASSAGQPKAASDEARRPARMRLCIVKNDSPAERELPN
jgi:hypothetical protein